MADVKQAEQPGEFPKASERKYYTLQPDFKLSLAPFVTWVNKTEQMKGFYPESSKPFGGLRFYEPPQIKFERKGRRGTLRDAYPTFFDWLVSDRLKTIFERIDPEACVFQRVDVDYSKLPEAGPGYWFCYFMRELDCVDEERSAIGYQEDIAWKNYIHLIDIRMKPAAVGSARAFRLKYSRHKRIIDDIFVDAMKAEKIRGFEFQSLQK